MNYAAAENPRIFFTTSICCLTIPESCVWVLLCLAWCSTKVSKNRRGISQCRHNGSEGVSKHQPFDYDIYPTVYSGAYQRKYQSSAPLAFVRGIHRWPVNSLDKRQVTRKMFLFDDVIMKGWINQLHCWLNRGITETSVEQIARFKQLPCANTVWPTSGHYLAIGQMEGN